MPAPPRTPGSACAEPFSAQADLRDLQEKLRAVQAERLHELRKRLLLRVQGEAVDRSFDQRAPLTEDCGHLRPANRHELRTPLVLTPTKPTGPGFFDAQFQAPPAAPRALDSPRQFQAHRESADATGKPARHRFDRNELAPRDASPHLAGDRGEPAGVIIRASEVPDAAQELPSTPNRTPEGLFVGKRALGQAGNEPLFIPLESLAKHTVVLAGAGSGKTVLVRRMVEEAALLGVPSIVVDGANDLSRLGEPWPVPPMSFGEDDRAKADRYAATTEVVVWTPGRRDGNPLLLDPLPHFADLTDTEDGLEAAIQMARASLESIAAPSKGPSGKIKAGLLASALRHFARSGGGSLRECIDLLADLPEPARGGFDKAEKLGRELADALRAEMATNPLLRGSGASLDPAVLLEGRAGDKTRISVVNLTGLADLAAQQHFVNQLAMTLFTWIKKNPPKSQALRGLLIVDEARDFVPSGKSAPSKDSLIRLVAQARKYGLGIVFATQAPKSIDHNIIVNCSTQFFGRTNSPAAIETVREQLKLRGAGGDDIAKLQRGCFYAFTDGFPALQKIEIPLCLSHHPPNPLNEREIQVLAARSRDLI